jgi:HEPN/RES N-terminal domain 1/RES domain
MGLVKQWQMEQEMRGYGTLDGNICASCVSDYALVDWIRANLSEHECTFCGAETDEPIAACFEDFVGFVLEGLYFDWNDPNDEGISYITAEGGWMAEISETNDVLDNYSISENDKIIEALINGVNNDAWVRRGVYHGSECDLFSWGWEQFKKFTKETTRYFFLHQDTANAEYGTNEVPPSAMLSIIAHIVKSELEEDVIKIIKTTDNLVRIRIGSSAYEAATEIGTPKAEFALQSNRMSPAGIPMFYGAFDFETARAETYDPKVHIGQIVSVGTFQPLRDLVILDLAVLPNVPSIFDKNKRRLIHSLRFLHSFAHDISKKINHDGREHIEYVPTQIVTEYFRRVFRTKINQPLDGVIYRSSRISDRRAFVIFCENQDCIDPNTKPKGNHLLRLTFVEHKVCK